MSTRVKVTNTGADSLDAVTVQVGLPSDCCAYKTGKARDLGGPMNICIS